MSFLGETPRPSKEWLTSLLAGGAAGLAVDVALFPIDTLKTRLQAPQGFWLVGGIRGIYSGLSAASAGSVPGAALFFSTYDGSKKLLNHLGVFGNAESPIVQMIAATAGEMAACLARVPTEIVKQRMQVDVNSHLKQVVGSIYQTQGISGLYRGYGTLLAREIPFALIQFPIWEGIKTKWAKVEGREQVSPFQGAVAGAGAGAIAASVTTPMDVVKTRLMLGKDAKGVPYTSAIDTLKRIYTTEGTMTLFSGIGPRTLWITIGGFVFFGMYEASSTFLSDRID